ncbi:MAG: hypothetical protein DRH57_05570 [Candidatus Cloacimonadota bacterium]|nr:MAG: hypothetical protein DRH57_05570 [Candidatus Cloacimonadota bacterium]
MNIDKDITIGTIYFTRHSKNRMRKFKIDRFIVENCIKHAQFYELLGDKTNLWCTHIKIDTFG